MNEQKLLTEQQISRRKTAAIWLIGVGLFFSFFGPIAGNWLREYLIARSSNLVLDNLLYFAVPTLEMLFVVWGLSCLKRLADPSAIVWVKHWIIAYIGSGVLFIGLPFSIYRFAFSEFDFETYWIVRGIISVTLVLAFALYRLWAIDGVCKSNSGKEVSGHIRVLQGIIVASILFQCVSCFVVTWVRLIPSEWNGSTELWEFIHRSLWTCWQWIGVALFFVSLIAIKGLIRSKLFASNAAEIAAFAEQPKPQTPFFTASVCGAIMAIIFCIVGTWLLVANGEQWITEIFW